MAAENTSAQIDASFDRELVLQSYGQVTLPSWVCEALGIQEGDRLSISIEDHSLIITPRKAVALQALRDIQAAFAEAGVTEEGLQAEGRQVREELIRARPSATESVARRGVWHMPFSNINDPHHQPGRMPYAPTKISK
jgi:AbrB family looped-hinge helix DNA binding protein